MFGLNVILHIRMSFAVAIESDFEIDKKLKGVDLFVKGLLHDFTNCETLVYGVFAGSKATLIRYNQWA